MPTVLVACALLTLFSAAADGAGGVTVLSSRPELVSGGDALLRVDAAPDLKILVNGQDVTAAFHPEPEGSGMTGLVKGLRPGANEIVATSGKSRAMSTLVNYASTGPIISGPHEQPFICDTERFHLQSGETLGAAIDDACSIKTRVDYYYRASGAGPLYKLLDPAVLPADAAKVTTSSDVTVPYVVRIETGTINRAIYQIAMLHDPSRESSPDFHTRSAGWNGRLIFTFGGGCPGGWYHQGARTGGVDSDEMLSRGFAVASSTLNVFGNNCNDLLATETMMMVKERFIEAYGPPLFTIGWGCSGGSYQSHQISDNYPGLLDGIVVGCSFPEVSHASISVHSFGARLMRHYFETTNVSWTEEQRVAASGMPDAESLRVHGTRPDRLTPRAVCDASIPPALLYDPVNNPKGARCTVHDHTVNVYGRDPKTGFARRFLDNIGVQYGLAALNEGKITTAQFLDLNEKIGGIDDDANFVPARTVGDRFALRIAYESGRILNGGGGLASTPVIDYRGYTDFFQGDLHTRFHSFSTRERLIRENGHAGNHVMLVEDHEPYGGFSLKSPVLREAMMQMDRWLTAVARDTSMDTRSQKVLRAKPADLTDACFDRSGKRIVEEQTFDGKGLCNELYPSHRSPYLVAGMPLANDVAKCRLKPVGWRDYRVRFTAAEQDRLRRIFPEGVCDYSKPGIEQVPLRGTWLSFGPSPVNRVFP
jgi:hypothetical protein